MDGFAGVSQMVPPYDLSDQIVVNLDLDLLPHGSTIPTADRPQPEG